MNQNNFLRICTLTIATLSLTSCNGTVSIKEINPSFTDFHLVKRPSDRAADKQTYFSHEYLEINNRRNHYNLDAMPTSSRPNNLVGLALSGGGMRSAAFQLGLLSGFNEGRIIDKTILNRIDYISSVSGGGWANGAYWASNLTDDVLFSCLNEAADKGKSNVSSTCTSPAKMLRTQQNISILPVDEDGLKQRKKAWEEEIINAYLPKCNIDFSKRGDAPECWNSLYTKPYPIFNFSHSVPVNDQGANIKNFPFQVTPDYLGTIIDCGSEGVKLVSDHDCGEKKTGFFVRQNADGYSWSNRKWQRYWKFWNSEDGSIPGATLSKAMATSSAVVGAAALLQYNFDLLYRDDYINEIREFYKLTDGGKTENLGLLPLVERGTDLIVVSYMGKDTDPVENPFEDLKLARDQIEKLLACDVDIPEYKSKEKQFIFQSSYRCNTDTNGNKNGILLHVKPTHENVKAFVEYLKEQKLDDGTPKFSSIVSYFEGKDKKRPKNDQFPQTPTMEMKYDEELIRAYYLLGRYIAKNHANAMIEEWLYRPKKK